jgi:hypothetical protein
VSDFLLFCRNATDAQLETILAKEWEAATYSLARTADYNAAVREAERRGWTVFKGRRA